MKMLDYLIKKATIFGIVSMKPHNDAKLPLMAFTDYLL